MTPEKRKPPAGGPRAEGKPTRGNDSTNESGFQVGKPLDPALCHDPGMAEAITRMRAAGLAEPEIRGALAVHRADALLSRLNRAKALDYDAELTTASLLADEADDPQAQEKTPQQNAAEILAVAPETIRRPLCLCGDHAYAATWPWVKQTVYQTMDRKTGKAATHSPPIVRDEQVMLIVRDDGKLFADAPLPGGEPIAALGVEVNLPEIPQTSRLWSGAGVSRYIAGERPDPADVFRRVHGVVARFMDFKRSLGDQGTMAELTAGFVVVSYMLDAFHVAPYLQPSGDRGAGKTHFLFTVAELAYLGAVVLAGGSYASLRDLADYGACIAFDDCENIMDPRKSDPDKRTLLLAGNRRGATVTFKEPAGKRGWITRHVHTFCPRMFSAIRLPDPVLASRSITIPLVRSIDDSRAKADPLDGKAWPCDRQQLIDDLWAMGLSRLAEVRGFDEEAASRARLTGRDLEPWRAILGVSLWLQEKHGVAGLFDRMEALSISYQGERADIETADPTRVLILALDRMFDEECQDAVFAESAMMFPTSTLVRTMDQIAVEAEIAEVGAGFTNSKRIGRLLERLRFKRAQRTANRKRWQVSRDDLDGLARSYGMTLTSRNHHGINDGNGNMAQGAETNGLAENVSLAETQTGTAPDDFQEVSL